MASRRPRRGVLTQQRCIRKDRRMRTLRSVQQISDRAWFVEGPGSNWTIVHTKLGTVLIDAGYPADAGLVTQSVRATGANLDSLTFILITHAHTDHIGGIPALLDRVPQAIVLCSQAELLATRGPDREQMTVATAGLRNLVKPRFARWALTAIRAGAIRPLEIPSANAFTRAQLASLSIRDHAAPGHTPGSTIFELVGDNAYVTGDAVVTDHPTYATPRVGAIDAHFSSDDRAARLAAKKLPHTVTILPGHGPALLRSTPIPPKASEENAPQAGIHLDLSSSTY